MSVRLLQRCALDKRPGKEGTSISGREELDPSVQCSPSTNLLKVASFKARGFI